ncbi:hypothetical protein, partial [Caballeronia sp. M23-90]
MIYFFEAAQAWLRRCATCSSAQRGQYCFAHLSRADFLRARLIAVIFVSTWRAFCRHDLFF